MSALVLFSDIAEIASRGDAEALETLVADDPTVVLQKDKRGKTALYYASGATAPQSTRCVEVLLQNKAQPNAAARNGKTPLHCCCEAGNVATFHALVGAGGSVNVQDRGKFTPLHSAARCGNLGVVKCLLEAACEVNSQSSSGWSPLHFAAMNNDIRMAMLLVRFDADLNTLNEDGHSPTSIADLHGHADLVNFLAPKAQDERAMFAAAAAAAAPAPAAATTTAECSEKETGQTHKKRNSVSVRDLVHHHEPESVSKKLAVLQLLHATGVPSPAPSRKSSHDQARRRGGEGQGGRRTLQSLSTPEVSSLLSARSLACLSSPFRAANINGAALMALDAGAFENLYDSVAIAYLRVHGRELTKTAFMAVVWPQLRAVIDDIVATEEGVEEAEIARCLAAQCLRDTESIEDAFRALDVDGSDSLSIAELAPAYEPLDHFSGLSAVDIGRLFEASPHAVDGRLNLEGFKALYNQLLQKQNVGEWTFHAPGAADAAGGADSDSTDEEARSETAQTGVTFHQAERGEVEVEEDEDLGSEFTWERRRQPLLLHRDGSFGSLMGGGLVQGQSDGGTSSSVVERSSSGSTGGHSRSSVERQGRHCPDTRASAATTQVQKLGAPLGRVVGGGDSTTFPPLKAASRPADSSALPSSRGVHVSRRVVHVQAQSHRHRRTNSDPAPAKKAMVQKKRGTSRSAKKQLL